MEYVIYVFGGVRATARAIGMTPQAVSKWRNQRKACYPKIPTSAMMKIIMAATKLQKDIKPSDLIYGRQIITTRIRGIENE